MYCDAGAPRSRGAVERPIIPTPDFSAQVIYRESPAAVREPDTSALTYVVVPISQLADFRNAAGLNFATIQLCSMTTPRSDSATLRQRCYPIE
jgi:hypothetical protein